MTPEKIKKNIEELRLLDSKKSEGNGALGWVFFKNRLTELALPTIEALLLKLSDAQAERDALQAELSSLKADMFVLNNDMGYTTGVLDDVLKQRDALQAECDALRRGHDRTHQMIDRALAALSETNKPALGQSFWRALDKMVAAQNRVIEILTGEGES